MSLDYNEIICESIDTIVKKRIEGMPFDKTVVCTIIDDTDRDKGHYIVSNGEVKFDAYSENEKYRKKQQVYVLIPNGDYSSSQKTIISRYSADAKEQPITYVAPFDQLVIMSNNLVLNGQDEKKIYANGDIEEIQILDIPINENSFLYTTIGFKGEFKSLLQNYTITKGEYGLKFELIGEDKSKTSIKKFSSDEMFGNPYAYTVYTEQSKKIDISTLEFPISEIKVYLYQLNNFYEYDKKIEKSKTLEDIYVNNISMYFANDITLKEKNSFEIACKNNIYEAKNNVKLIQPIWYRSDSSNKYIPFPQDGYLLKWYYYDQGVWTQFSPLPKDEETANTIAEKITLRQYVKKDYVKAILEYSGQEYNSNTLTFENKSIKDDDLGADRVAALNILLGDKAKRAYPMYNENNTLINFSEANVNRALNLSFSPLQLDLTPDAFFEDADIYWYLPKSATMLKCNLDFTDDNNILKLHFNREEDEDNFYVFKQKEKNKKPFLFYFQIQKNYNFLAVNNTIKCKVIYKGLEYWAKTSFTFSSQGSNGTKYTPIIYQENGNLTISNKNEKIYLKALLYDPNFELIQGKNVLWEYFGKDSFSNEYTWIAFGEEKPMKEPQEVQWIDNSANLVRATINVNKDLKVNRIYPLIYSSQTGQYANAPVEISYSNSGVRPKYYNGSLELFNFENKKINNVVWSLDFYPSMDWSLKENELLLRYLPKIIEKETQYSIQAPRMLMNDVNIYPYLVAKQNDIELWRQPLLMISDAYEADLLNDWDGNLEISDEEDKNKSYVLSTMIGAGRKDDKNTFSGVLMGDVSLADKRTHTFGLYGYNKGIQSFRVGVDGVVNIGKSGKGQIIIDGNGGSIKSGNYNPFSSGMLIDLDEGHIDAYNFKISSKNKEGNLLLDSSGGEDGNYFKIGTNSNSISFNKSTGLLIKTENFMLKSHLENPEDDDFFKIGNMAYGPHLFDKLDKKTGKPIYILENTEKKLINGTIIFKEEEGIKNNIYKLEISGCDTSKTEDKDNQEVFITFLADDKEEKKVKLKENEPSIIEADEFNPIIKIRSTKEQGQFKYAYKKEQEVKERLSIKGGLIQDADIKSGSISGSYINAGTLFAKQGQVGGWILAENKLYAENRKNSLFFSPVGNIVINVGGKDASFAVSSNGVMKAKNAVIDESIYMGDKLLKGVQMPNTHYQLSSSFVTSVSGSGYIPSGTLLGYVYPSIDGHTKKYPLSTYTDISITVECAGAANGKLQSWTEYNDCIGYINTSQKPDWKDT